MARRETILVLGAPDNRAAPWPDICWPHAGRCVPWSATPTQRALWPCERVLLEGVLASIGVEQLSGNAVQGDSHHDGQGTARPFHRGHRARDPLDEGVDHRGSRDATIATMRRRT